MNYSVSIRPRYETFLKILECKEFIPALKVKLDKYIISQEKGNNEEYNHYQCYFKYKKKTKSSNVRRQILTLLKKHSIIFDKEELLSGLKCKEIKTNLGGTIGYTLKEEGIKLSNFTEEERNNFLEIYEEHLEQSGYDKKNFFRINNKNFHIIVEKWIKENSDFYKETGSYEMDDIKVIMGTMIDKGYYLTFLNSRNTKERLTYILHYLNRQGIKYIERCFNFSSELENMTFG